MDFLKNRKTIVILSLVAFAVISIFISYRYLYIPHKQQQEGWVYSKIWDCPTDYPIKGNLHSHIYHTYTSPYYDRTSARNCKCFDSIPHAQALGFRAPLNK